MAFLALLWLGRGLTFFADEWAVMADRTISLDSFLQPFNEHWLGVTIVVYRLMLQTFGLGTYMPYWRSSALLHVVVVLRGLRRSLGGRPAPGSPLAARGHRLLRQRLREPVLVDADRVPRSRSRWDLAALLLLDGIPHGAASRSRRPPDRRDDDLGFGIFMLVLVGLDLLLDRLAGGSCRRCSSRASSTSPGTWRIGRSGVATARDPFTLDALLGVPRFLLEGVGTAFGSVLGRRAAGRDRSSALALAVGIVVQLLRRRPVSSRAIACFGAIVFMYALLALIRAQLFDGAALYSRYAYLSGIFAILGLTALIGRRALPGLAGPATGRRRRIRGGLRTGARSGTSGCSSPDEPSSRSGRPIRVPWSPWSSATGPQAIDPDKVELLDRTVTRLREVLVEFGSPIEDSIAGDAVPPVDPAIVEQVRQDLSDQQAG